MALLFETPDDVRRFQATHASHLGKQLLCDGIMGPVTRWAIALSTLCETRQLIVRAAQVNIGLVEVPPASNDDPHGLIAAWLRRVHAKPRDPWCAAVASWVLSQALKQPVYEGGAERLGKMFPPTLEPVAGDLFWYPVGQRHASGHQPAHVGVVGGTDPNEIMGYEGNCSNAYRCTRRPRAGLNFSRTVPDVSGSAPGVILSVSPPPGGTR